MEFSCVGATSATSVSFSFLFRLRLQLVTHQTTIQAIQAEADETGAPWDHIDAAKPLERAVKEWAVKCDEAPAIRSFGVVAWRMWRCVGCCQSQQLDVGSR